MEKRFYTVEVIQSQRAYDVAVLNKQLEKDERLSAKGFATLEDVKQYLALVLNIAMHKEEFFEDVKLYIEHPKYPHGMRWKEVYDELVLLGRIDKSEETSLKDIAYKAVKKYVGGGIPQDIYVGTNKEKAMSFIPDKITKENEFEFYKVETWEDGARVNVYTQCDKNGHEMYYDPEEEDKSECNYCGMSPKEVEEEEKQQNGK